MIDKKIIPKMSYEEVEEMMNQNNKAFEDLQERPEIALIAGIPHHVAVADIYSEQAQLMRRMAEIYDERATALRER